MKTLTGILMTLALIALAAGAQAKANFVLRSNAFADGATIPMDYSYNSYGCTGKNLSPDFHWSSPPKASRSLALTAFDPDANQGKGWWHWVVYGIDPSVRQLPAGAKHAGVEGSTSFGSPGYGGPCPPPGDEPHHYVFTLYAVDKKIDGKLDGPHLLEALKGHVLAKAVLTGRFGR